MDEVYDLIQTISKLPELYLGNRSVQRLYAFLGGFLHRNHQGMESGCLNGFTAFVEEYFQVCLVLNWADLIELHAANEDDEWTLFMKLFEEYTSDRRK